jgi:hypothetical protein
VAQNWPELMASISPLNSLNTTEVNHVEMDVANIWHFSLQQFLPDVTGVG